MRVRYKIFVGLTLFQLLFPTPPALGQEQGAPLQLRPGDALSVAVGREPALGGEFVVGEDGRVLLPMVGFVTAVGLPFPEVRKAVEDAYARELRDGRVAVAPRVRVALLGEVRTPGLRLADPTLDLTEMVASAGGFTPEADPRSITLTREGRRQTFSFDDGSGGSYAVRSGDQIVVGRRSWVSLNRGLLVSTGSSLLTAVLTALILR